MLSSKPRKIVFLPLTNRKKPNTLGNHVQLPSAAPLSSFSSKGLRFGPDASFIRIHFRIDVCKMSLNFHVNNWIDRGAWLCNHTHSPYVTCRAGHISSSSPFYNPVFSFTVKQIPHGLKTLMGPFDPASRQCS